MITKHPGTGGLVTVETVTAQLLYEIDGARYLGPDVVSRFDTESVTQEGTDRVRISGTQGEPPPPTFKVGASCTAGWRNEVTFGLTGLDVPEKAAAVEQALWAAIPEGRATFDRVQVRLLPADRPDAQTGSEALALLTVAVASRDRAAVAGLSRAAVELALASYPGFFLTAPPRPGAAYVVFWPTLMPADQFAQQVTLAGRSWTAGGAPVTAAEPRSRQLGGTTGASGAGVTSGRDATGGRTSVPLGRLLGARSGDKAGNALLGLWARDDPAHCWLAEWWTEEQVRALVPETRGLELRLWWLPNLRAVGCTFVGMLGYGVAANLDLDGQAKGLGEYVRARHVDVPVSILR